MYVVTLRPMQRTYVACSTTFIATSTSTTITLLGMDAVGTLIVDDLSVYACVEDH